MSKGGTWNPEPGTRNSGRKWNREPGTWNPEQREKAEPGTRNRVLGTSDPQEMDWKWLLRPARFSEQDQLEIIEDR